MASLAFQTVLFSNERIRVSDFRMPCSAHVVIEHTVATIRWQVDDHGHRLTESTSADAQDLVAGTCEEVCVADRTVFYVEPGTRWDLTTCAWLVLIATCTLHTCTAFSLRHALHTAPCRTSSAVH